MTSESKKRLILALKFGVALAIVAWLLSGDRLDFRQLAEVGERWPWLLLAQLPFAFVLVFSAARWRLLLEAQGIRYRLREVYSLTMIGWLFNQVMLGTVGGDVVKAYLVARDQHEAPHGAVISVFVDRALGLFVLLLVALVAVAFNLDTVRGDANLEVIAWAVAGIFVATLLFVAAFYSSRLRRSVVFAWIASRLPLRAFLRTLDEAVYTYKFHPGKVAVALALSILIQVCVVLTNICLARALLDGPLPWGSFFFLVPVAHVLMALPINPPSAFGTAEAIYSHFFSLVQVSHGALICILQRATALVWALVGCVFYLQRRSGVARAVEDARGDDHSVEDARPEGAAANERSTGAAIRQAGASAPETAGGPPPGADSPSGSSSGTLSDPPADPEPCEEPSAPRSGSR